MSAKPYHHDHPTEAVLDGRRAPVNITAARVLAGGDAWAEQRLSASSHDSINPLPFYPAREWFTGGNLPDLTGHKIGDFTILGFAGNKLWVVRCVCGIYSRRSTRALRNKDNPYLCCDRCNKKKQQKRFDEFRQHGRNRS